MCQIYVHSVHTVSLDIYFCCIFFFLHVLNLSSYFPLNHTNRPKPVVKRTRPLVPVVKNVLLPAAKSSLARRRNKRLFNRHGGFLSVSNPESALVKLNKGSPCNVLMINCGVLVEVLFGIFLIQVRRK